MSREGALVLNNLLLAGGMATVFLGTFYPLFAEVWSGVKLSVGPQFFNATFVPILVPAIVAMVFAPLGPAPLAGLAGFVDTAVWDLSCATFDTRRELAGYCERWSAAMIAPLVSLALPEAPAAQAHAIGVSLREIELLLALAADARSGRLRIPLDELEDLLPRRALLRHLRGGSDRIHSGGDYRARCGSGQCHCFPSTDAV